MTSCSMATGLASGWRNATTTSHSARQHNQSVLEFTFNSKQLIHPCRYNLICSWSESPAESSRTGRERATAPRICGRERASHEPPVPTFSLLQLGWKMTWWGLCAGWLGSLYLLLLVN
jgi:hypothetical protein